MYTKNQLGIIFRLKKDYGACKFPQNLAQCNNLCPFWHIDCRDVDAILLRVNEILSTISEEEIFEVML